MRSGPAARLCAGVARRATVTTASTRRMSERDDDAADPDERAVRGGATARPSRCAGPRTAAHDDEPGDDHVDGGREPEHQPPDAGDACRPRCPWGRAIDGDRCRRTPATTVADARPRAPSAATRARPLTSDSRSAGPTGSEKSPCATDVPLVVDRDRQLRQRRGRPGRRRAWRRRGRRTPTGGTGTAAGGSRGWYRPTGQPGVGADLRVRDEARRAPSLRGPASGRSRSGSTRMSTAWPSAESAWPSGKTVTSPSSGHVGGAAPAGRRR